MKKSLPLLISLILMTACTSTGHQQAQEATIRDAQYLCIIDTLGCTRVDILSPWQSGALMGRYYLVADDTTATPADGLRLRVPIQRLATTSATQIGFLHALDAKDCVIAMATPHLIYNAPAHEVTDLGEDFNLNMESLLLAQPDLLLMTAYGAPMTNVARIREAGIPVMELVEWMEQDPLARAAWIRLYGYLTCTLPTADSILTEVTQSYNSIVESSSALGTTAHEAVSLATGQSYRGTWYVPSAATYMGRLILDAGADYIFASDTTQGSIPLTLEQALTRFAEADTWIGVNANSLEELRLIDEKHTWMKAYKSGRVYNFARRTTPAGGNDFWETGIVHPDYILTDIQYALSNDTTHIKPHFIRQLQ